MSRTGQWALTASTRRAISSGAAGLADIDRKGHVLETGRDVCDSEEPAQIQPTLSGHIDAIERDIKHPGICRVDDLLAGAKGGEDQLDGGGTGVGAADQRWLVDVEPNSRMLTLVRYSSTSEVVAEKVAMGGSGALPRSVRTCSITAPEPIDLLHSHCRSPSTIPAARLSPRRLLLPEAVFYIY